MDFAEALAMQSSHADAARVYLDYCQSPEDAVVAFLEAGEWRDAWHTLHQYKLQGMLESHLRPEVSAAMSKLIEE